MSIDISLLKTICETPGVPGYESPIRNVILESIEGHVDEVSIDNMGNVVALKKGTHRDMKVMVAAHMDEIGFIVTHVDDNGFVRFTTLGGFDPKTLTAQRVVIHGKKDLVGVMGAKPIHVMSPEERNKMPKVTDYYIDLGMTKEEVDKYVYVGAPVTRQSELIEMGDCVNGKSIDNRISVYILIEVLKKLGDVPFDVYGVFTVQEEVGIRGANVAAHSINPDFGFGLDTTIAYDLPGAQPHEMVTQLGKGAAIKILDASAICDYRMIDYMKNIASSHDLKWQSELLVAGGTDTAGVQRMGKNGAISGAVSIPTRHLHQVIEMANKSDIEGAIALLRYCLEEIDNYDWDHK